MRRHLIVVAVWLCAGAALAAQDEDRCHKGVTMIAEEDGKSYLVEPGETLENAMARASQSEETAQQEEKGNCVPDNLEHKPEDTVACKCYEYTECKGTSESRACKRHCRKDLCKCCSI